MNKSITTEDQMDAFIDVVDSKGEDAVAAILGFAGDIDAPEDLAELMIDAFSQLPTEDAAQALRKLAMVR